MSASRRVRDTDTQESMDSVEISLKLIMVLALVMIITVSTIAQTGDVRVIVTDKKNNEELSYATVTLWNDSSAAIEQITDANGEANFNDIPAGKYKIRAKALGYQAYQVSNANVDANAETTRKIKLNPKVKIDQILSLTVRISDLFRPSR